MWVTLWGTCLKKTKENESAMFKKISKHWRNNQMHYWLMKSEPDVWSIDQQKKAGKKGATWDGVRNYQAANNLKKMKIGDLCFFYHSNIGKEIVGIVKVIKEAFIDKTDKEGRFVAVQVRFQANLEYPVSLEKIKKTKTISHLPLIKQSRLSVMPIDFKSWKIIYKMGKISSNQGKLWLKRKKQEKNLKRLKKINLEKLESLGKKLEK